MVHKLLLKNSTVQKDLVRKKKGRVPKKNKHHTFEKQKYFRPKGQRWFIIPLMQ